MFFLALEKKKISKWLLALIAAAVVLPLFVFVGNLKVQVPESPAQAEASANSPSAPELAGISAWINSEPLSIADLKGKVVLVDFWTYSCINCIRTLPYLNAWQREYSDDGLVIIGVHAPEFDFEKDLGNVQKAVSKYGVKYAVALDNNHDTWNAFHNSYWPRKYLIDMDGKVRYDHIGEGGYGETEKKIQELLKERASVKKIHATIPDEMASPEDAVGVNFSMIATPELYLGYQFARVNLGNDEGFKPGKSFAYTLPAYSDLRSNVVYVGGTWKGNADNLELASNEGRIVLRYTAKDVNIVAGPGGQPALLQVILDGNFISTEGSGSDVDGSKAKVSEQRLYNIVSDSAYATRTVEINVKGKGFKIYTFTFG